jgi:hypothetical protein
MFKPITYELQVFNGLFYTLLSEHNTEKDTLDDWQKNWCMYFRKDDMRIIRVMNKTKNYYGL